jgi:hypothetical protein
MRVTDGSSADDPVMGVNLTFATTLARPSANPGGQSVLLGELQTQAATAQDGTASIIPSAANVGVCDLFIAVSAGAQTAQFQMESLAAIVLPQPQRVSAPPRAAPISHSFAVQRPQPQPLPTMLTEVPESIPLNDPAANQSACPEARQNTMSGTDSNLDGAASPCEPPAKPKAELPPSDESSANPSPDPLAPKPAQSTERNPAADPTLPLPEIPSANPGATDPSVSNTPLTWRLEDKRSCRLAQTGAQLFLSIY